MEDVQGDDPEVPALRLTANQVVAWNIAWLRREAGLTQAMLGERLGWPHTKVSEAERSFAGTRTREFDAQELTEIALALGVPLIALFLPPQDDGTGARYLFGGNQGADGGLLGMGDLMERIVMPDSDAASRVMDAYRMRLRVTVSRYLDPGWAQEVAEWLSGVDERQRRRERAAHFRMQQAAALGMAEQFGQLADAIDPGGEP